MGRFHGEYIGTHELMNGLAEILTQRILGHERPEQFIALFVLLGQLRYKAVIAAQLG